MLEHGHQCHGPQTQKAFVLAAAANDLKKKRSALAPAVLNTTTLNAVQRTVCAEHPVTAAAAASKQHPLHCSTELALWVPSDTGVTPLLPQQWHWWYHQSQPNYKAKGILLPWHGTHALSAELCCHNAAAA
jgi:hypothetical protein